MKSLSAERHAVMLIVNWCRLLRYVCVILVALAIRCPIAVFVILRPSSAAPWARFAFGLAIHLSLAQTLLSPQCVAVFLFAFTSGFWAALRPYACCATSGRCFRVWSNHACRSLPVLFGWDLWAHIWIF